MQLEGRGVPTVVVTTTQFATLTARMAAAYGLPDARVVVVDHPLGGTDAATISRWAESATDRIITEWTRRSR